jgi:glycogen phosphorylase/synthase
VKLVQVPIYLDGEAGLFDLQYEAVLAAMDVSCFPSFYEPWGYTPAESIGLGVPTITTDCAGFGVWARAQRLGPEDGIDVLDRLGVSEHDARSALVTVLERHLCYPRDRAALATACKAAADRASWSRLVEHYFHAFDRAAAAASTRAESRPASAPRFPLPVRAQAPTVPAMPALLRFDVAATLPAELEGLDRLARNLWWSWDAEAPKLFEDLSPRGWRESGHNPVVFLRRVWQRDLEERARDGEYRRRLARVLERFDAYMSGSKSEYRSAAGTRLSRRSPVAYFCFEFGIHESVRIYSGGLGVLAGDHLKSASDLDVPLVAVGLLYRKGYVDQRLGTGGEQLSSDRDQDPRDLPLVRVTGADGQPLSVQVQLPHRMLRLAIWRADVGRVPLFLLDSDVDGNGEEDRRITHRLYGAGQELRLLQEIALGQGGVRALEAVGIEPAVLHLNEGHAAFAALENVAVAMRRDELTFAEARELIRVSTAFTTHTPVPAGHDVFPEDLMRRFFSDVPQRVGLTWERFMALGTATGAEQDVFNMTYLAMNLAGFVNGVAEKHEEVSRSLLRPFWSGLLENELPITHVTNGVHLASWTRPEIARVLGAETSATAERFAACSTKFDARRFWEERSQAKRELLVAAAHSLQNAFQSRQDSPKVLARILDGLRSDALIIGFARRFAPYKRATLLFKDPARLEALLRDEDRPVLFLFSGKAHPADGHGKELVRQVAQLGRTEPFIGKVVFLENYDIGLARKLVQGCDVWLNNPIRPLEASGTSGMKVAANGGLNLSVLDGWWLEGYDGKNGWAIGGPRIYKDQELQDQLDNEHLMHLLEDEVVPMFFDREDGIPQRWIERVRRSIATLPGFFNTDRMVTEYADRAYGPLAGSRARLSADRKAGARRRAAEHERLRRAFEGLALKSARIGDLSRLRSGDAIEVEVVLDLGSLAPDDVLVELVLGHEANGTGLANMSAVRLEPRGDRVDGAQTYAGRHVVEQSGAYGYGIRARFAEIDPFDLSIRNLVRWA